MDRDRLGARAFACPQGLWLPGPDGAVAEADSFEADSLEAGARGAGWPEEITG
jgi:hypothetical protein